MLWFLGLVGLAAAAVAGYNSLRQHDPDGADALVRTLTQVTTVLAVITQAVATALDALGRPTRPFAVSEPHGYAWREFE